MPIQDLTPQLRTRLSRVERTVGWFVMLATLLMLSGFVFYIYHTAQREGWFVTKVRYYTLADTALGLREGDPVKLMGFDVGEIIRIDAQPPEDLFNVYIEFQIKDPYYGYLWSEGSFAKVSPSDFLGKRSVEVTKGTSGVPTYIQWEIRQLSLEAAQALTDFTGLVLAQEIPRTDEEMVLAMMGQPLTTNLVVQLSEMGIGRVFVMDRQGTFTNEIEVAGATTLTNFHSLLLTHDVRRPSNDQVLIRALTPLSYDVILSLARRGISTFSVADKSKSRNQITAFWDPMSGSYRVYGKEAKPYWLPPNEDPALTDRLNSVVAQVESAVPSILNLTNQLAAILNATTSITRRVDVVLQDSQPIITNLADITGHLREPEGSLGQWLIPTNLNLPLQLTSSNASSTLASANATLTTVDTNLATLAGSLNLTLINLASITSNLNTQVQTNDQILGQISRAIVQADELMQGLKRHWLLRSAFKDEEKARERQTNRPPARPPPLSPRGRTLRP